MVGKDTERSHLRADDEEMMGAERVTCVKAGRQDNLSRTWTRKSPVCSQCSPLTPVNRVLPDRPGSPVNLSCPNSCYANSHLLHELSWIAYFTFFGKDLAINSFD